MTKEEAERFAAGLTAKGKPTVAYWPEEIGSTGSWRVMHCDFDLGDEPLESGEDDATP